MKVKGDTTVWGHPAHNPISIITLNRVGIWLDLNLYSNGYAKRHSLASLTSRGASYWGSVLKKWKYPEWKKIFDDTISLLRDDNPPLSTNGKKQKETSK
jgi:hypothetical protein